MINRQNEYFLLSCNGSTGGEHLVQVVGRYTDAGTRRTYYWCRIVNYRILPNLPWLGTQGIGFKTVTGRQLREYSGPVVVGRQT